MAPGGSLSSPGEFPHFAWDSRTPHPWGLTPRLQSPTPRPGRGVPLSALGESRTHPSPVPGARVGTWLRRSLPQPPTGHHQAVPPSPTTRRKARGGAARLEGVMLPRPGRRGRAGGGRLPPRAAAAPRGKFGICRGSPQTGLLGFYLPAFVQQRCQVPRRS